MRRRVAGKQREVNVKFRIQAGSIAKESDGRRGFELESRAPGGLTSERFIHSVPCMRLGG